MEIKWMEEEGNGRDRSPFRKFLDPPGSRHREEQYCAVLIVSFVVIEKESRRQMWYASGRRGR